MTRSNGAAATSPARTATTPTAMLVGLERLETTVRELVAMALGDGEAVELTWTPRSLRGQTPGEVSLTVHMGAVAEAVVVPVPPPGDGEKGARAGEARQLVAREKALREMILRACRRLVGSTPAKRRAEEPRSSEAGADEKGAKSKSERVLATLRVARVPLGYAEIATRTGLEASTVRNVMMGLKNRKKVKTHGKRIGVGTRGHKEHLWVHA